MKNINLETFAQNAKKILELQIESRIAQIESGEITISVMDNLDSVNKLLIRIKDVGRKAVVEEVAYTWFNRICALRFMDARGYNKTMIVSPLPGMILPEILSDALSGVFNDDVITVAQQQKLIGLLDGSIISDNAQRDIYRILLVSSCNALNNYLPFLFEKINDYTDLLLPEDLLSANSIISKAVESITIEECSSVEVLGWLYQFYISEKKDEVMKSKKNRGADEIPAATQLFTPEWIVRYLVENSIGRLWMQNHPESNINQNMQFYIEPQTDVGYLKISNPSEFKICDPCCGSGHMLTYSFDLLFDIYMECGYTTSDAVSSIIENNIYGIEIDERAGQLAYFALMMKAREKDRRFFRRGISPNICVLSNVKFTRDEISRLPSLFNNPPFGVEDLMRQFEHADILGSMITPCVQDIQKLQSSMKSNDDLFDIELSNLAQKVIKQADYLSGKYNIIITNPPYIAPSTCDAIMKNFAKTYYPDSKSDLGTMFIERNFQLCCPNGLIAMITLQSWMFLTRYEKLREKLIDTKSIASLVQIGANGFDAISGEVVQTAAYVFLNKLTSIKGSYVKLTSGNTESEKIELFKNNLSSNNDIYVISSSLFKDIPGSPIAYWASERTVNLFMNVPYIENYAVLCKGLTTSDNDRFVRFWYEPSSSNVTFNKKCSTYKWFPFNKGGSYRKWYGNNDLVVNFENDGEEIKKVVLEKYPYLNTPDFVVSNQQYYFKEGLTWSVLSSNRFSMRYALPGSICADKGQGLFCEDKDLLMYCNGFLNSVVASHFLQFISPMLDYNCGYVRKIPFIVNKFEKQNVINLVTELQRLSQDDWNSFEGSWNFKTNPLVEISKELYDCTSIACEISTYYGNPVKVSSDIELAYLILKGRCKNRFDFVKKKEIELNNIFINTYNLDEELTSLVDDSDVSVYQIFDKKSDIPDSLIDSKYILLREDIVKNFISYAVGCMFGRYSLYKDGLTYYGGEWNYDSFNPLADSIKPDCFMPDKDNVIPVLDDTWFDNDIESQFIQFVKNVFGSDSLEDNLKFIEKALGKSLRRYFSKDFYKEHVKLYQKRPIYWMFSSPKGNFKALVYMHRYNENTANIVLSLLRDFRAKVKAQLEAARKDRNTKKENDFMIVDKDLDEYENEILYPLAVEHVTFNLDDGIKVNYQKLGKALIPIK